MRSSTSASAAAVCAAAVSMLRSSPAPPLHARAFGLQLLASSLSDSGDSSIGHVLSLAQAISLIDLCSTSITQDQPATTSAQVQKHSISSFAPHAYPLVLPLPQQTIPPLYVAAASGIDFCFDFCYSSSLHAQEQSHRQYHAVMAYVSTCFCINLTVLTLVFSSDRPTQTASSSRVLAE